MDVIKLSSSATRELWEVPIVHEDEQLLAVDKPAGLLSSSDRHDPKRPNLMRLLHEGIATGKSWATRRNLTYLSNAHRLDFETSGIMLLAKTKPTLVALANSFGTERPVKTYLALVSGNPPQTEFEVDARIGPNTFRLGEMRIDPKHGKKSCTRFKVAESFSGYAAIRCRPLTDRTHQIRIHLKHAGYPLLGDRVYGGKPLMLSWLKSGYRLKPGRAERPLINRVALHAQSLQLPHPVTGATVLIEVPLPKDLRVALRYLREFRSVGVATD